MIASLSLRRILVSRGDVHTAYLSAWRHMANTDLGNARYRTRATCPVGCARESFLHASNTVPHGVPGEGNHHDFPNHMASKDRKATVRADMDTAVYPPEVGYMHGLWPNRPRRPRREKGSAILRKVTQHIRRWKEADAMPLPLHQDRYAIRAQCLSCTTTDATLPCAMSCLRTAKKKVRIGNIRIH